MYDDDSRATVQARVAIASVCLLACLILGMVLLGITGGTWLSTATAMVAAAVH